MLVKWQKLIQFQFLLLFFFFTECRDLGANCDRTRVLCTHPGYASYMKQNCKATCGYCTDQTDYNRSESSYLPGSSSLLNLFSQFLRQKFKSQKVGIFTFCFFSFIFKHWHYNIFQEKLPPSRQKFFQRKLRSQTVNIFTFCFLFFISKHQHYNIFEDRGRKNIQ